MGRDRPDKSPAFQWYPKDILSSARVALLTLREEGAYRRAIDFCWLNGSIPADAEQLAGMIGKGCTAEEATRVADMFIPDKRNGTRLVHDRLEIARKKQRANRKKKSDAGKASALRRQELKELRETLEANRRSTGVPTPVPTQGSTEFNSPSPSPSPTPVINKTDPKGSGTHAPGEVGESEHVPGKPGKPARVPKAPKEPDPTMQNANVIIYREETHLTPSLAGRERICHEVLDSAQWRLIVQTWCLRGFKKHNLDGMLDWNQIGIPANGNGRSYGRETASERNVRNIRESFEYIEQIEQQFGPGQDNRPDLDQEPSGLLPPGSKRK